MIHIAHTALFAALVAVLFAHLQAPLGRRVVYALKLWGLLFGVALALGLLMSPLG